MEVNYRMNFNESFVSVGWIRLAHDRDQRRAFVYTVLKLRVP